MSIFKEISGVFRMCERGATGLMDGSLRLGSRGKAPVGRQRDDVPQNLKLFVN